jgi:hypothetical protein
VSVRVLYDDSEDSAVLYCSTSGWAFGPLFTGNDEHNGQERADAFLDWLQSDAAPYWTYERTQIGDRRDARLLTDDGMQRAFADWMRQEDEQFKSKDQEASRDSQ